MATAQKRGFRLPWANEPPRDADDSEPNLAERLGAVPDELGDGPFDLTTDSADPSDGGETPASGTVDPRTAALDLLPADDRVSVVVTGAVAGPASEAVAEASEAVAAVDADEAPNGTDAAAPVDAVDHADAAEAAALSDQMPSPKKTAWPETDRRSQGGAPPPPRPGAATGPRRDNPLMAGLVRAMRDAAKVARDEAVAALHADAAARTEAIRAGSTATTAALRRTADADIAGIREWSKAEMARIREETEASIVARKERLVAETEDEARASEELLARLSQTVGAYEAEAGAFFDALLAEDDPARLAGLAERMPSAPVLDAFPPHGAEVAAEDETQVAEPAGATTPEDEVEAEPVAEAPQALADASTEAVVVGDDDGAGGTPESPLDPEAAAAAEAEAFAGLDTQTQLIVSGLADVGAIAGFRATLVRCPGVSAVSVNAGADGDVLFTVTHGAETDVREVLRDMPEFEPRLIADDGTTLVAVAHPVAA